MDMSICMNLMFMGPRIIDDGSEFHFSSVQSLSRVRFFATPWTQHTRFLWRRKVRGITSDAVGVGNEVGTL